MALTPEYLQGLPEELENLTMQFEADIIADISRRIVKAGMITDTAEYQLLLLKQLGASSDYLEKLIARYTKQSEKIVKDMVFDAAQTDSEFYENFYARTHRDYVPFEYNDYLQQLADAAVNQTLGELNNFTRSMGFSVRGTDGRIYFKQAADVYRSAMDKAHFYAALGGMDYLSAVRMAAKEITAAGLQFVDYASGRNPSAVTKNHADVAARRALLTGVSQMTGKISERNAEELETDVVEVTAHAGARPDHAEWQGQWYSLTGRDKRYPLLAEVTGYGRVDGLKGANCRHDFYPVIPGISERAYTDEQLRNIDPPPVTIDGKTYTYYEAQQKQRAYERTIRKTKREIIAADASGDTDMFTAKSVLLRRQKDAYGKFSKDAGLLPRIERTGVAEYGQSISAKAVWADRKKGALKNSANVLTSGKISDKIKEKIPITEPIIDKLSSVKYSALPEQYRADFEAGLERSHTAVKNVVESVRDKVTYVVTDEKNSYYMSGFNYIKINPDGSTSTLAHEIFHKYDISNRFTRDKVCDKALDYDYAALMKASGGDIKSYLVEKYPNAFKYNKFNGATSLKSEYNCISDIISGLTNDSVDLGFHHRKSYWESNSNKRVREAFANFGQIYYENNPAAVSMFEDLFPSFAHNVFMKLQKG